MKILKMVYKFLFFDIRLPTDTLRSPSLNFLGGKFDYRINQWISVLVHERT
jgi:hypothetical protein